MSTRGRASTLLLFFRYPMYKKYRKSIEVCTFIFPRIMENRGNFKVHHNMMRTPPVLLVLLV